MSPEQNTTEAASAQSRQPQSLVEKVQALLDRAKVPLAETFGEMTYIKQAVNRPEPIQRMLINRELRLHLGTMDKPTPLSRLALDDQCDLPSYLKNFSKFVIPDLKE